MRKTFAMLFAVLFVSLSSRLDAGDVTIAADVVYGHKLGLAMTCDVFTPAENPNGAAVLFMVSGGWYSSWTPPEQAQYRFRPLTDKGFTVFAARHGSSPKFSIAEAVADVRRSVRFIRSNAEDFGIDPKRIGVFGLSAGGHLSLMLGTASDEGNSDANDPIDRVSSRVDAVVAYVAPSDLRVMAQDAPERLSAYDRFPALQINVQQAESVSPLVYVTSDDAPTLLLAGAADELVPIEHSRNILAAFEKANVASELIEFNDAGHRFHGEDAQQASEAMVAWFVTHLATSNLKSP